MLYRRLVPLLALMAAAGLSSVAQADTAAAPRSQPMVGHAHDDHATARQPQPPHQRLTLPPSAEQRQFNLPPTRKARTDLQDPRNGRATRLSATTQASPMMAATPECSDMNKLASYSGDALAQYLVSLPDYECTYGLFSLSASQAATIYSAGNFQAVANRFAQEAAAYNATNMALVNLTLYLRAGYYLASGGTMSAPSSSLLNTLRPAVHRLTQGTALFRQNKVATSTAAEVMTMITNQNDEAQYLADMRSLVQRYTNSSANPNAASGLRESTASNGFTGVLTVIFYSHYRADASNTLHNDHSYPLALNNFVLLNKSALLGTETAYQLNDAAREAFRFMQYPEQQSTVKPMIKNMLATTSMTGPDSDLWIAAAEAVKYYDNANCAEYGTCNFEQKLADQVLKNSYTCSPSIRIRAQQMTTSEMQQSCSLMQQEETYFHDMMQTGRKPVANDNNTQLEVVVFDDYTQYSKYAGVIYGISTDNGGMYLEGTPSAAGNQARFIAHEASWLRPTFSVWNLQHEYVHYLDGRFDMYGDFTLGTSKPDVWWIEGLAEYLSLKNNDPDAIAEAKKGTYKLSTIFKNTYDMSDYVTRAYKWGYMAVRFMNERHRSDIDAILPKFRAGDYDGYQRIMDGIGTRYDSEFASWVQQATTSGEPPMPGLPVLPPCSGNYNQLGKGCSISGFNSSGQAYAYIILPAGAKNLKLWTTGGSGDADLYVAADHYPSTSSYDVASAHAGTNSESVSIATPVTGRWYYIMMNARAPFSGVTINASYD